VSREALLFLEDIEKSCAKIVRYTEGLERDQVFVDEMRFDAVLFNLHVVGEAVKKAPSRSAGPISRYRLAGDRGTA
jgi:uncharacterized protein with HEPN domain